MKFFKRKKKNKSQDQGDKQQQSPDQSQPKEDVTKQQLDDNFMTETVIKAPRERSSSQPEQDQTQSKQQVDQPAPDQEQILDQRLDKTQANFGKKMKQLFSFKKKIDEELFEDLETTLLMADVGANATTEIMEQVRKSLKRRNLSDADAVLDALREQLTELASEVEAPLVIDTSKKPFVILVVGVNGVGKTTT
ncbi:MAG: signal recognition particle receptor subunit alpha, partial [Proteobacteria bacterium]|nr:signal recognition particle receptor subunit alpha [Pseudomonadota bacterium]